LRRDGGDLFEIAALAFKFGMPEDEALKAITINPTKIIGVDDRVGSLEEGKDADMLILRGHPFKTRSIPEAVFINGKRVYKMEKGARL
jgi:imidazolonepropionase-like amidohydrolase